MKPRRWITYEDALSQLSWGENPLATVNTEWVVFVGKLFRRTEGEVLADLCLGNLPHDPNQLEVPL